MSRIAEGLRSPLAIVGAVICTVSGVLGKPRTRRLLVVITAATAATVVVLYARPVQPLNGRLVQMTK